MCTLYFMQSREGRPDVFVYVCVYLCVWAPFKNSLDHCIANITLIQALASVAHLGRQPKAKGLRVWFPVRARRLQVPSWVRAGACTPQSGCRRSLVQAPFRDNQLMLVSRFDVSLSFWCFFLLHPVSHPFSLKAMKETCPQVRIFKEGNKNKPLKTP